MATGIRTPTNVGIPVYLQDDSFQEAWINFINSLRKLLAPPPTDRGMDQYLPFRDEVLNYMLSKNFVAALQSGAAAASETSQTAMDLLIKELKAYPLGVEVMMVQVETVEKKKKKRNLWQRLRSGWIGKAKTVTGSVKDLLENLPGPIKMGLTLLEELIDLFKGSE